MKDGPQDADSTVLWEVRYNLGAVLVNVSGFVPGLAHLNPWRSVVVAAISVLPIAAMWDFAETPTPFAAAWLLTVIVFALELATHRAYVTPRELVVESGPWPRRRHIYPLRQIKRVAYERSVLGGAIDLDIGNVDVEGDGWAVTLVSVRLPEHVAQRILDAKAAANKAAEGKRAEMDVSVQREQ